MIELGTIQKLKIKKREGKISYLYSDDKREFKIPTEELPKNKKTNDEVEVFLYSDGDDFLATTKEPRIKLGELAILKVKDKTRIGAFLNMGLDKDLFLPFKETIGKVEVGKSYLVRMYIDKSGRLAATMKIRDDLENNSPYKKGDIVSGTIYSINKNYGIFVAVDEKYDSLIPNSERLGIYQLGEIIEAEVSHINDDGRMVLSLQNDRGKIISIDDDAEKILDILEDSGGVLAIGEKPTAEEIKKVFNMSKTSFNKAIKKLSKEKEIRIYKDKIELR